jgi:ABC-2 type transport system ATP-binding protein
VYTVRVDRLTKRYGTAVVLDGVTFEAVPGRVTGFLGRNGAGKTMTLRILVGLAAPTSGSATIGGLPYAEMHEPARHVGALLDGAGFHPGMSARSQLQLLAHSAGVTDARVDQVLALTDLAHAADKRTGKLSLGMRQRLTLAAVLLADPSVLILDEPANGLDPPGLRWLRDLLRHLADDGRTILVSSHQLNEVAVVADDVVVLNRGRVVAAGPVAELTRPCVYVRSPVAADLAAWLDRAGMRVRRDGTELRVLDTTTDFIGDLAALMAAPLHELRLETSSVEDLFFASIDGRKEAA